MFPTTPLSFFSFLLKILFGEIDSRAISSSTLIETYKEFPQNPNHPSQILHIMAATLHHAQPVLSAASSAGFRESGLQSLRCLDFLNDASGQSETTTVSDAPGASPIVAVRSSGLSLESIIGYCEEGDNTDSNGDPPVIVRSLVTEEYLQMLVALANERFVVNRERVERFRTRLLELCSSSLSPTTTKHRGKKQPPGSDWEDAQVRRERKRAEGLQRKKEAAAQLDGQTRDDDNDDTGMGIDF
jgi:tRNA wybutosine-synthesizing protein 3